VASEFCSGEAIVVFDGSLTILDWNAAAEELTGIPRSEAIGRPCWEIVGGVDDRGGLVCHAGCSGARLAREGWPVKTTQIAVRTARGTRKPVTMSTIAVRNGDLRIVHAFRNGVEFDPAEEEAPAEQPEGPLLTERQLEVLHLIDTGLSARSIAAELRIAEATVRNHIRAILVEFRAHSQLEALAHARRIGLI
jgi:PAS domain S-box-containing protein